MEGARWPRSGPGDPAWLTAAAATQRARVSEPQPQRRPPGRPPSLLKLVTVRPGFPWTWHWLRVGWRKGPEMKDVLAARALTPTLEPGGRC